MKPIFIRGCDEIGYDWYACPACGHEQLINTARGWNECPICEDPMIDDEEGD